MDYQAILYGPIYRVFGVTATIQLEGGDPFDIVAIDNTDGVAVGNSVDVQTVLPAAVVLMPDLAAQGVAPGELDDGLITLNGKTWTIDAHRARPSPNGEADGELYLILRA